MKLLKKLAAATLLCCWAFCIGVSAQGGNTISGHVFDNRRQPIEGITVELQDEFSRSRGRVRTNTAGRYFFNRMPAGTYLVKISPFGTNYAEQVARIEIQNMTRTDPGSGLQVIGAYMNAQRDFYLRLDSRQQVSGKAEAVFAQDVPEAAKALYEEGENLLNTEKKKEGYKKIIAAIETFPDYYLAIEKLGVEYFSAKHFRASSVLLQRAVQIHPKSFKGWYVLGRAFSSLDLNADALKAAQKASTLRPDSVDALFLTGRLLRLTSSYKDSEKHLTKAKKLAKTPNADIHWELALLYGKKLKRYKQAAKELEAWLKLRPKSIHAESIKSLIIEYRRKSNQT